MVKPSQRGITVGASASVGWINKPYILPGETNAFLSGYSGNFSGAYGVAGAELRYHPASEAQLFLELVLASRMDLPVTQVQREDLVCHSIWVKPGWSGNV